MWSRCFPAYAKARELIEAGAIGEVQHVQASFGEYSPTLVPRIREKELAGGALLDRGNDLHKDCQPSIIRAHRLVV